jgi:hypothetical protein
MELMKSCHTSFLKRSFILIFRYHGNGCYQASVKRIKLAFPQVFGTAMQGMILPYFYSMLIFPITDENSIDAVSNRIPTQKLQSRYTKASKTTNPLERDSWFLAQNLQSRGSW